MRAFLEGLARRGLVVPMTAALVVASAAALAAGERELWPGVCAFLVVYGCYRFDAWTDVGLHGSDLQASRTAALTGRVLPLWLASAAVGVGLALAYAYAGWLGAVSTLVFPTLVALYGASSGRRGAGARRLKDIPGLKSVYVALGWGLLGPWGGVLVQGLPSTTILWFSAWLALLMFVNTVACDVKDLARDRAVGTMTLPLLWGPVRVLDGLRYVNAASAAIPVAAVVMGEMPLPAIALVLPSVYLQIVLRVLKPKHSDAEFICDVELDACGLALIPFLIGSLAWG